MVQKKNEQHLVEEVVKSTGIKKSQVTEVLENAWDIMREMIRKGDRIVINDFMRLEVVERKAYMGRNPHTNEAMEIPARNAIRFKAGKALKEAINAV